MNIFFHIANALVLPPAVFFAYHYYKFNGREINFRALWVSISLITITFVVTSCQFIFPAIIGALDRNKQALFSGEVWRLITPLFIQPLGLWQCLFNGMFFIAFLPIAEHFYGRWLLLIYFGAGLAGQIVNFYWNSPIRGGSSTALYGTMGSLLMYILLNRKTFPRGYILIPIGGFSGAIVLCFFKDGHAPALLVGALLALAVYRNSRRIDMKKITG